jgi:hypothetical protein
MKSSKRLSVAYALGVGTWYKEVCRKNTKACQNLGKKAGRSEARTRGNPKRRMLTRRATQNVKSGQTSQG